MRAKIISTGSYLPERVLTNHDLEQIVNTTDQWIIERTGITERHIAGDTQSVSDLAAEAAMVALRRASISADSIDLIIVATITGDMPVPATACFLQRNIGAVNAAAFDVNAACSGFIYGLSVANAYILAGLYRRILVIGAETLSKVTDWEDRNTCVLFGDGAGAVIVEAAEGDNGILSIDIYSDGTMAEMLQLPGGGSRYPTTTDTINNHMHYIKMKGNETFKVAVRTLERLVTDALAKNNLTASDLALLIPHQANMRIISATADRLGIGMDKVMVNLHKCGNTSAASIPIALDEAVVAGRVKANDVILLEAFGGGLTWASALIRW
ncbi:MAG: beta-ketoacyl-ACP synthase III [Candidatus Magnetobacterium sp. LHC-1]|uniref:Beta-ketoacyl-[acyl-carrier-protein] synthase III n=1 Tax=Candidatus Magnetobacterium casense TaxID=1455061 RepID=A0ABS6S222_9BACT|nr:beta-ketoacyl-ACP synthase III [Candidatus Magnetobacterium casensis]MBF0607219.1 ketoacyl-ACP synthase III [Nitrospirota bacterium]MBV6342866.1 ketoacyl-ACP synthase III [Candidatus Magnetobacterium casensis]